MSPIKAWSNSVRRYAGESQQRDSSGLLSLRSRARLNGVTLGGDKRQHGHACPYVAHKAVDWAVLTTTVMPCAHPLPTDGAFSCLTSRCWLAAEELVEAVRALLRKRKKSQNIPGWKLQTCKVKNKTSICRESLLEYTLLHMHVWKLSSFLSLKIFEEIFSEKKLKET